MLQYLYQSRTLGITYYRDCDQQRNVPLMYEGAKHPLGDGTNKTQVFADSDYAADESRRSTMGGIIMQNGGTISWFRTLGKTVALLPPYNTATKGFSVNFPVIANEFIAPKDARTENKLDLKNKNQKTPDVSLALNTNCTPLPN